MAYATSLISLAMPPALRAVRPSRPTAATTPRRYGALRVAAHGPGGPAASSNVSQKAATTGFVAEMRKVAMSLHTREQAPKEGKAAPQQPQRQFAPSKEGYLQFLVESKAVYDTLERIVAEAPDPSYVSFQNTGMERSEALANDIKWMEDTYGLKAQAPQQDGPGVAYSRLLEDLAASNPPAFICHYYNTYFAHTAGGMMIGKKVSSMLLDSAELEFYKFDGDVKELQEVVRADINKAAEGWSREEKDRCLEETLDCFKYAGGIMQTMQAADA